jgi:hypothetical protein
MPNLSSLAPITTAATALSNLILVSPQSTVGYQPQNPTSPNGQTSQPPPAILFHYEGEQTVSLESDITDHYIEDNTAIQDQISLKPETITTHGFIGELNNVTPTALAAVKAIADKLTIINAYTPALSATALLAYNEAFQLYQVGLNAVNSAVSAWSSLSGAGGESVINGQGITLQPNQTKQQIAFQQFYGYWRSRTLFTVQTPWAVFQNMAIKNLRAIQDAETRMITDFEVTFKIIRTAATVTTPGVSQSFQGRASSQAASLTDLGTSTPVSSISLSQGLTSNFPSAFAGGL